MLILQKKMYNVQLKENFKIFIGGPSRCGKTTFVVDLIQNLSNLAVVAPTFIIYIYKVWQPVFDEMNNVNVFLQDGESIDSRIKSYANGQPILVIFDDLISSKFLNDIAPLFTVDARHLNISLIFLSQRLYVNDEHFRQISQNCDYFIVFKNPRNLSEIRTLAQQITPGSLHLTSIYREATKDPFSYLFINLTQEAQTEVKFVSHLLDRDHILIAYVEQPSRL